jgi:hypothetical protein
MRLTCSFVVVMAAFMFCGAASRTSPRYQCKNDKCLRPNVLIELDVGKGSPLVLAALPVGKTRLLVPTSDSKGMVQWDHRVGSHITTDPTYRLVVFNFPTDQPSGLFSVPYHQSDVATVNSLIHSHIPKVLEEDTGWEYRVKKIGEGHVVLDRPLNKSELGAAFYSPKGMFIGVGAEICKNGETVVVTVDALVFFMTPDVQ